MINVVCIRCGNEFDGDSVKGGGVKGAPWICPYCGAELYWTTPKLMFAALSGDEKAVKKALEEYKDKKEG